jgi:hypothetical protein
MDVILLIIDIVYGVCRIVIKSVQQCTYFVLKTAKQIRQIKKNVYFRSTADPYYTPLLTGQYFSLYVELQLILKFAPKNHRLGISFPAFSGPALLVAPSPIFQSFPET